MSSNSEIAIFVSHRTDLDSVCVNQPIYHHMKCGVALAGGESFPLAGDNTGDNISEKKATYSELTVQYWAWKNYTADYYGLCHYRRYLSFSDECFPRNDYNVILEDSLDEKTAKIHELTEEKIRAQVQQYDVIVGECFDTTKITRARPQESVFNLWLISRKLVEPKTIYLTIDIIKELYPQYYDSAMEYLRSKYYRGYNCFVMRKDLFYALCQFQFDILYELEQRLDMTNYSGNMLRTPGYMGELLFGTYIWHLQKQGCYHIKENPIVFFDKTEVSGKKRWIDSYNADYYKTGELAIFVSHRIDKKCNALSAPCYHHMRCGAAYDRTKSDLDGDNTKDNISEKGASFGLLTVQYWMWKNYRCDYYGLCHYRRYFSFSNKTYPQSTRGYILEEFISPKAIRKYRLEDQKRAKKIILNYDAVFPVAIPVSSVDFLHKDAKAKTVLEVFLAQTHLYENHVVYKTLSIVKEKYPQYYQSALNYLKSEYYHGYNCFILNRNLFYRMCQFEFDVLFELEAIADESGYRGNMVRTPAYMAELLYGIFITWLQEQKKYKIKELQLVFFSKPECARREKSGKATDFVKKIVRKIFPSYRVCLRLENKVDMLLHDLEVTHGTMKSKATPPSVLARTPWEKATLTSSLDLTIACLALEIHETHKASFSEFRNCYLGKRVVVVATGPTMRYYSQIPDAAHIGMNAAYKNQKIKLDYYFITDFENRLEQFVDLKYYDFIKFFGQYSTGTYRDRFQASEQMILENNGRRFFQGAPCEDIPINIEYYPLMAFYSVAFQAIQFALYTNAKQIFLVGCDCSSDGYFDGTIQANSNPPKWVNGYKKLKEFVARFYPETEIISINPIGLKGLFHDVYTQEFLDEHPEIDPTECEFLDHFLESNEETNI